MTEVEVRFLSFLIQHFHSYNPGYFVFCKHFNVIVMEVLYVHGAEMFAKTKLSGFLICFVLFFLFFVFFFVFFLFFFGGGGGTRIHRASCISHIKFSSVNFFKFQE